MHSHGPTIDATHRMEAREDDEILLSSSRSSHRRLLNNFNLNRIAILPKTIDKENSNARESLTVQSPANKVNGNDHSALKLGLKERNSIASERVYNNDYENESQKNAFSSFGFSLRSNELGIANNNFEPGQTMPLSIKPVTARQLFLTKRGFTERLYPINLKDFNTRPKEEFDLPSHKRQGHASTAQGFRDMRR